MNPGKSGFTEDEMDGLRIIRPDQRYLNDIAAYRMEFILTGDTLEGCGSLETMEDPDEWLEDVKAKADEKTVPEGWVVSTQFICVRESDDRIVGMIDIRHSFNDFLRIYGGNIGYSVRPCERRKGYAKWMLSQALIYCRNIGMDKVLVNCLEKNGASRRTILANGGKYESTIYVPGENVNLERYWIESG